MNKKTVLFLHPSSDLYGADRSLVRTVNAVKELGVNVVVCLPYKGPLESELIKEGIRVYVFRLGILRRSYFNIIGIFHLALVLVIAFVRLNLICTKHKVTLIHSNTSAVIIGGVVAKFRGLDHLWHIREIIVKPRFIRMFIARMYKWFATLIIAVSDSVIDNLELDYPSARTKSIVINNGIDPNAYNFGGDERKRLKLTENDILIGMIGRINAWKGQDLFIEVASKLYGKYSNIYFMMLGSPFRGMENLVNDLKDQINNLGLKDRFFLVDFQKDVGPFLSAFDIFILPSKYPDPFPTTGLEAMLFGKAIVANGHGGVCDMIEESVSGFLVSPPNTIEQFENKIETLINNDDKRKSFGLNARRRFDELFTEDIYRKHIKEEFSKYLSL